MSNAVPVKTVNMCNPHETTHTPAQRAALKRQLAIKTGVVRRLEREVKLYQDEAEANRRKRDELKAKEEPSVDAEWHLKNAENVLQESLKMVPDTEKRLGQAVADLKQLVQQAEPDDELSQDDDLLKAREMLETAET